ncbi:hypothetical protein ACV3R5_14890 [Clostridium perfringens]|uniref:hypothetical protein n=1 Tax=Clostridium perfringens TaxID=1502 RepID=UPI0039ED74FB
MLFFRDNITYKNLEFDKEQINILKYIIENSDKLNKEFKNDKSLKCNIYLISIVCETRYASVFYYNNSIAIYESFNHIRNRYHKLVQVSLSNIGMIKFNNLKKLDKYRAVEKIDNLKIAIKDKSGLDFDGVCFQFIY